MMLLICVLFFLLLNLYCMLVSCIFLQEIFVK